METSKTHAAAWLGALVLCATSLTLTLSLLNFGLLDGPRAIVSAAAVVPALAGMWIGQQIRQLLMAQLLIQSRRHYGDGSGAHLRDIGARDARFDVWAGRKSYFVRGILTDDAAVLLARFCDHD